MIQPTAASYMDLRKRPRDLVVMRQRWADLLFLHWKIPAVEIQRRLPKGLFVDTYQGDAWIGVVPFSMNRIRPSLLPPVPGISWFLELNVRTYVFDENGIPGVWFFSLDCNQPLAVTLAQQLFHLPYQHAAMQRKKSEQWIDYSCRRESDHDIARYRYKTCEKGKAAEWGSLEFFLLERYLLYSVGKNGQIFTGRVHHSPYLYESAVCESYSARPLQWDGFMLMQAPDSLLSAEAVDVSVFPLRKLA